MYTYRAKLVKVVDGDTIDVLVDHGMHIASQQRLRLIEINTPEPNSPNPLEREAANKATEVLKKMLKGQDDIYIRTHKDSKGSFGRYLAEVYTTEIHGDEEMYTEDHVNHQMLNGGFAARYGNVKSGEWTEAQLKSVIKAADLYLQPETGQ